MFTNSKKKPINKREYTEASLNSNASQGSNEKDEITELIGALKSKFNKKTEETQKALQQEIKSKTETLIKSLGETFKANEHSMYILPFILINYPL